MAADAKLLGVCREDEHFFTVSPRQRVVRDGQPCLCGAVTFDEMPALREQPPPAPDQRTRFFHDYSALAASELREQPSIAEAALSSTAGFSDDVTFAGVAMLRPSPASDAMHIARLMDMARMARISASWCSERMLPQHDLDAQRTQARASRARSAFLRGPAGFEYCAPPPVEQRCLSECATSEAVAR